MHMSILSAYTYVYHVHTGCLWGSEEDIGSIRIGAGDGWELPEMGVGDRTQLVLEEQPGFLTPEPFSQPP